MSNQAGRPRTAADVLADWREAERTIEDQPKGSPSWHRARLEAAGLADEYHALVAAMTDEAHHLGGDPSAASEGRGDPAPLGSTLLRDG